MILSGLEKRLVQQHEAGLTRMLNPVSRQPDGRILIDGNTLVNFSSNDYLGLSHHKEIKRAFCEGIERYGVGAGGALVVCGYDDEKASLEKAFADFVGTETCLFFQSGYTANLSVVSALCDEHTDIFIDKMSHASIYDALSLKQLTFKRFCHNDMTHLALLLKQSKAKAKLIISEGVFSMTGHRAPVDELVTLKHQYDASLMIDDAHAMGVVGAHGKGSLSGYDQEDIDIIVCPLSKAFSAYGAVVCTRQLMKDALLQFSRPLLYSTALPQSHAYGLQTTLSILKNASDKRARLLGLIAYFREQVKQLSFRITETDTPIQLLSVGDNEKACALSQLLKEKGYYCYPMRSPTVPKALTGLRIVLSASLSETDINGFCLALREAYDLLYS